ncbi:endoribonuclease L-PSP [Colletotrichum higginsianum]|nr:endoribonuclease L-PSP [Colletotrichum higginsianum]
MTNSRVAVTSDKAPKPYTFLSQAIVSGGHIFCSGQVGTDPETGNLVEGTIQDRTTDPDKHPGGARRCRGDSGDVVKVNIYLADMSQFAEVNAVYETFFESPRPARTCVSVKGLPYGTDVEMECVANAVVKA